MAIAAAACLVAGCASPAPRSQPPQRLVQPAASVSPPCISILMENGVTVSIPEDVLTDLAASRPVKSQTMDDHFLQGRASGAEVLLAAETGPVDRHGCRTTTRDKAPNRNSLGLDPAYIAAHLIEHGIAAVSTPDGFARAVTVEGWRECHELPKDRWIAALSYGVAGLPPFLTITTCIDG